MKSKEHIWKHVGGPPFTGRKDSQYAEYREIQKETGVSPDETASLELVTSMFLLPRLKMFRDEVEGRCTPGCFKNNKEWIVEIEKMIDAFSLIAENKETYTKAERARVDAGLNSFREYYFALWW